MKRLFVFGCSFTAYCWPTWADLLSLDFDHYENWGLSGIGNRAIAERVAECNVRNQLGPNDVVIVQWSTHLRNDFFHEYSLPTRPPGWKTSGSIFNYLNLEIYDQKWIETFFYEPAYVMHTLNFVSLTQRFLDSLGVTWYMTSIGDLRNLGNDLVDGDGYNETILINNEEKEMEMLAWQKFPELAYYQQEIWGVYKEKWLPPLFVEANKHPEQFYDFYRVEDGELFYDMHPSVRQHNDWLEKFLMPTLNVTNLNKNNREDIVNSVEELHQRHKKNKEGFEMLLQRGRFTIPEKFTWPNYYRGYH